LIKEEVRRRREKREKGKSKKIKMKRHGEDEEKWKRKIYNKLHGAESFLRSRQSLRYSRIYQNFKKTVGFLPCPQEPSTGPYPQPDQSSPCHPILPLQDPFSYCDMHAVCLRNRRCLVTARQATEEEGVIR
jgi:hypothetical protein